MIDLDELMRLHAAATPGPWQVKIGDFESEDGYGTATAPYVEADGKMICVPFDKGPDDDNDEDDAHYIVAACNAVPELVSRIRELADRLYEAVGCIISNESQSMIDCRICFFEQYCGRGKGQCNPDHDMCRKAILRCVEADVRKNDA